MTSARNELPSRLLVALALAPITWSVTIAAVVSPGDVYYQAHVQQRFKYYVFVDDYVQWTDDIASGTSLSYEAVHDTAMTYGQVTVATSLEADAGRFAADFSSDISLEARTGIFHQTQSDVVLETYVRGPSGTPYDVTVDISGLLIASREGGEPGSLQPLNGVSTAVFEDSTLTVENGGTFSLPWASFETSSGLSTSEITVDGEVYSLAFVRAFQTHASVTQDLCILGCMRQPADFHALSSGTVIVNVYPNGIPVGTPGAHSASEPPVLLVSPNPMRSGATISFEAPVGTRAIVDVFAIDGRRVARLIDAVSPGGMRSLHWSSQGAPNGIYFLRAATGGPTITKKVTILE